MPKRTGTPTAVVRKHALDDLAETATLLHGRDTDPLDLLIELGRQTELWRQRGAALPAGTALAVLRQLPGLADYQPLDAWAERVRGLSGEGIETEDEAEHRRRQRAYALADWLRYRAGSDIAERVVIEAERVALSEAEVA